MHNSEPDGGVSFGFRSVGENQKQELVNDVFSKVARRYDQMNDLMSGGLHRLWKDDLVALLNPPKGTQHFSHLDVAGGTGDVAFRIAHAGGSGVRVVVADISPNMVDLESEGIDVVIRSGKGDWPGLTSHFLLTQTFTPVCSPHYIAREGRPETPGQILNHILIDRNDIWWPIWFEAAGLSRDVTVKRPSIDVNTQQMAAILAVAGSGIALVSPAFVGEDMKSGRLIQLFDVMAKSGSEYFLAYSQARRNTPKIRAFRDWILKEAGTASQDK